MRGHVAQCVAVMALSGMLAGCQAETYMAQTRLNPDGSVTRSVLQPKDSYPESNAPSHTTWQNATAALAPNERSFNSAINELPIVPSNERLAYWAVWGRFASAREIPASLRFGGDDGLPASEMVRQCERRDRVFVVEHRWNETLTDIVSLPDALIASRELGGLIIEVASETLQRTYGSEYDVGPLRDWAAGDGQTTFTLLCAAFYESSARHSKPDETYLGLAKVADRFGLHLRDEQGRLLEDEKMQAEVERFFRDVVRSKFRRKDGTPLSDAQLVEILKWGDSAAPQSGTPSADGSNSPETLLKKNYREVVREKFPSEEAYEKQLALLCVRIFGRHLRLFRGRKDFRYSMKFPGQLIETNGLLLSDSDVEWNFEQDEAFPLGFRMHGTAVTFETELQQKLLGHVPLTDRAAAVRFLELLNREPSLIAALEACRAAGSMAPFWQARSAHDTNASELGRYNAMLRLLDIKRPVE